MLTPEGQSGDKTDKIMLLKMWTDKLRKEQTEKEKDILIAGMGNPTFHVSLHMVEMFLIYWHAIEALIKKAINSENKTERITESLAINYGDARGDFDPRKVMAEAMTTWYNAPVTADNILFTAGGAGAIHVIFNAFNCLYEDKRYRVITPFPHYSLYAANKQHQLHPVDVMKEPGYQLTATALETSIKSAYKLAERDNNPPKVVLLCNPSNPLGTIIPEDELKKIAEVLRNYPDLKVVMDEAYAEMCWSCPKLPSLLAIAPDLQERITILRSATKALSAAGERLGMLMTFDKQLMGAFRDKNIEAIGHAARSAQMAYAYTMQNFTDKDRQELEDYYKPKVDYVYKRIQEMGATMPDPAYKVEGTFYVLCDLSELLGEEIPLDAQRALGKGGKIQTSEELVYSLLFQDSLMVAPGAYFGMNPYNGFIRITCSDNEEVLKELMDRLENRILLTRKNKVTELVDKIQKQLSKLENAAGVLNDFQQIMQQRLSAITINAASSLELKEHNIVLEKLLSEVKFEVARITPKEKKRPEHQSVTFFTPASEDRALEQKANLELQTEWREFVNKTVSEGSLKNHFLNLSEKEKQTYLPWLDHLKMLEKQNISENTNRMENIFGTTHAMKVA